MYFTCVSRPARAPTASVSTSAPTSRARWWSSVTTVSQCRIISAVGTSTPVTWWKATGPSMSTPTTVAGSISWGPGSIASSATGGPPAPPPGPSAESPTFNQDLALFFYFTLLFNFINIKALLYSFMRLVFVEADIVKWSLVLQCNKCSFG